MDPESQPQPDLTVLWDRDCGFCAFMVALVLRADTHRVLRTRTIQESGGRRHARPRWRPSCATSRGTPSSDTAGSPPAGGALTQVLARLPARAPAGAPDRRAARAHRARLRLGGDAPRAALAADPSRGEAAAAGLCRRAPDGDTIRRPPTSPRAPGREREPAAAGRDARAHRPSRHRRCDRRAGPAAVSERRCGQRRRTSSSWPPSTAPTTARRARRARRKLRVVLLLPVRPFASSRRCCARSTTSTARRWTSTPTDCGSRAPGRSTVRAARPASTRSARSGSAARYTTRAGGAARAGARAVQPQLADSLVVSEDTIKSHLRQDVTASSA